uniref:Uncharacterized protein n=1 Tax=Glossina austeni TaxID=7395 RepID=A0A1A9UG90_GLOAU
MASKYCCVGGVLGACRIARALDEFALAVAIFGVAADVSAGMPRGICGNAAIWCSIPEFICDNTNDLLEVANFRAPLAWGHFRVSLIA